MSRRLQANEHSCPDERWDYGKDDRYHSRLLDFILFYTNISPV